MENGVIKKYRLDIIVIAALLIISLSILLIATLTRKEGATVEITVNGDVIGEYPLALDNVYVLNGGTNTLRVEGGRAYMSYSNCPDHTCENTGKIRFVGEQIVCLPNRITITIKGESDGSGVDFVS